MTVRSCISRCSARSIQNVGNRRPTAARRRGRKGEKQMEWQRERASEKEVNYHSMPVCIVRTCCECIARDKRSARTLCTATDSFRLSVCITGIQKVGARCHHEPTCAGVWVHVTRLHTTACSGTQLQRASPAHHYACSPVILSGIQTCYFFFVYIYIYIHIYIYII